MIGLHIWATMESYEVLGIFGMLNILSVAVKLTICIRMVLRRLFHGGVPVAFRVYGNLSVCISRLRLVKPLIILSTKDI